MSAYMVSNVGIGDLCKHRISMSAYIFNNIGAGDLCQHRISMSAYRLLII